MGVSPFTALYGPEAYLLCGRVEEAHRMAVNGASVVAEQGQAGYEAHASRLMADIEGRRGHFAEPGAGAFCGCDVDVPRDGDDVQAGAG